MVSLGKVFNDRVQTLLLGDRPLDEDLLGLGATATFGQCLKLTLPHRCGPTGDALPDVVQLERQRGEIEARMDRRRVPDFPNPAIPFRDDRFDRGFAIRPGEAAPIGADRSTGLPIRLAPLPLTRKHLVVDTEVPARSFDCERSTDSIDDRAANGRLIAPLDQPCLSASEPGRTLDDGQPSHLGRQRDGNDRKYQNQNDQPDVERRDPGIGLA